MDNDIYVDVKNSLGAESGNEALITADQGSDNIKAENDGETGSENEEQWSRQRRKVLPLVEDGSNTSDKDSSAQEPKECSEDSKKELKQFG